MNFTVLLFLGLIVFGLLYLSTKFLGKTGLYIFIAVMAILNCVIGARVAFLSTNIWIDIIAYIPTVFALYLMYKNYGLGDFIKSLVTMITISLAYALINFTLLLYLSLPFFTALDSAFVPFLISLLSVIIALIVVFIFAKNNKLFNRFNDSFKWFLIIGIALFADCLVFTLLTEARLSFGFGQILLDFLMGYVFELIILGTFFVLGNLVIKIDEDSNFDEKIKNVVVKTYAKTKDSIKKTSKKETTAEDKEDKNDDNPEIIVEDEK